MLFSESIVLVVTGEDVTSKVQPIRHGFCKLTIKGIVYIVYSVVYLAVCSVGAKAVSMLSNRVAIFNAQAKLRIDKDTWPPGQLHKFTPFILVHDEGQQMKDNR